MLKWVLSPHLWRVKNSCQDSRRWTKFECEISGFLKRGIYATLSLQLTRWRSTLLSWINVFPAKLFRQMFESPNKQYYTYKPANQIEKREFLMTSICNMWSTTPGPNVISHTMMIKMLIIHLTGETSETSQNFNKHHNQRKIFTGTTGLQFSQIF